MNSTKSNISRYVAAALVLWTALLAALVSLKIYQEKDQVLEFAVVQARSALNKDLSYRRWNSSYGGVYVPVTERSQPNPYLTVPNRDVTTTDGIAMTLINPAYMTRQVHEMSFQLYGEKGHITSLNPIRPQNAADEWETAALQAFEQGVTEVRSEATLDGKPYLRYMIPLITEEGCLKCHAAQGYKIGDIRGGLSVSVPMENYLASYQSEAKRTAAGYGVLWLVGLAGILLAGSRINRQMSEQRLAAEEISRLNTTLEQRVEERTRELREAQTQLLQQEKFAVLGQVAGSVGHELRNPLGIISNAVYFLKMAQPDATEKIKEYLDLIENHVNISDKIVTDLLDFNRIKTAERMPVSIPDTLHLALERFPAPDHVTVEFDLPADLPHAYADIQQTTQVFSNLILNAFQAMETQGGKLTLAAEAQAGQIRISVRDTGHGIPPEDLDKIFEPLFTTKIKGIGLGLTIAKKLIVANDGRIEVRSAPGTGSEFIVWLQEFQKDRGK